MNSAIYLLGSGMDIDAAYEVIWRNASRKDEREIRAALVSAQRHIGTSCLNLPKNSPKGTQKWPTPNVEAIEAICGAPEAFALYDLWEASPLRIEEQKPSEILQLLYDPHNLICASGDGYKCVTQTLEAWGDSLNQCHLIVSNPMSKVSGATQQGKNSARSNDNACLHRRFLVVEFDQGTLDEQAAVIAYLARHAPLVMVLHSGGKSIHAWYFSAKVSETIQRQFFNHAVMLGADPQLWSKCQLARMPQAKRPDNGKTQGIYYLDTEVIQ
jgi:hypothetical protein